MLLGLEPRTALMKGQLSRALPRSVSHSVAPCEEMVFFVTFYLINNNPLLFSIVVRKHQNAWTRGITLWCYGDSTVTSVVYPHPPQTSWAR